MFTFSCHSPVLEPWSSCEVSSGFLQAEITFLNQNSLPETFTIELLIVCLCYKVIPYISPYQYPSPSLLQFQLHESEKISPYQGKYGKGTSFYSHRSILSLLIIIHPSLPVRPPLSEASLPNVYVNSSPPALLLCAWGLLGGNAVGRETRPGQLKDIY